MTTWLDMQNRVYELTKRPELVTLTVAAIKMATIRAHHVDFFPRDYASAVLNYTLPSGNDIFVDVPNIYTTIPLLRTPDFLQGEDASTLRPNENLAYLKSYQEFWGEDNELQYSHFAQVGTTLKCLFSSPTGRAKLYYYQNPNTSDTDQYSSWIADMYQNEVAMWAAGIIWARSGNQEMAKNAQSFIEGFKDLLVESHLTSKI